MIKLSIRFLIAELIVLTSAIMSFTFIEQKMTAGFVAGMFFVSLGIWIVAVGIANKSFRRSGTFVVGCLYLFAIALPLMITRFLNTALEFADVRVLGLPGPIFHNVSTGVYSLLMAVTALDVILALMKNRKRNSADANDKRPSP